MGLKSALGVCACLCVVACTSPPAQADGGSLARADASSALPTLGQAIDTMVTDTVDLSCRPLGAAAPGAPVSTDIRLVTFDRPSQPIGMGTVCWMDGAADPGLDCRGACLASAEPAGNTSTSLPLPVEAFVDLCVRPTGPELLPVIQMRVVAPSVAAPTLTVTTIGDGIVALVSTAFMTAVDTTRTATIGGRVIDCGHNLVFGAEVRLFDLDGTTVRDATTDPGLVTGYLRAGTFVPTAHHTNGEGVYGIANVRVADVGAIDQVRVEAWGVLSSGGAPERIGCEVARIRAGMFTAIDLGPTRADYPAGHPCLRH